ncbi:MAG: hypothetical protein GW802_28020 [Armatimonadetes bacterium]|nr:hypothetical protein [Armatimonadota bacterium]NCP33316.1 hypothetical protein [Armatimonadota bacterium]NCQ31211.1 hypothetical protein [Armatimonadota bacterium]
MVRIEVAGMLFRRKDHRRLKSAVPVSEHVKAFVPIVVVVLMVVGAVWIIVRFFE